MNISFVWSIPMQIVFEVGWNNFSTCLVPTCRPPLNVSATSPLTLQLDLQLKDQTRITSAATRLTLHPPPLPSASLPEPNPQSPIDWLRYDPATDAAHFHDEVWSADPARWHDWWRRGSEAAGRHIFDSAGDAEPFAPCDDEAGGGEDAFDPGDGSSDGGGSGGSGAGSGGAWGEGLPFPAVIMSLAARRDRRRHAWRLARALGFRNVSFPPTTPAAHLDVDALVAQANPPPPPA
jgi:hypothetical protein